MPATVTLNRPTHGPTDTIPAATYNAETVASASVPDATTAAPGAVQLAGDGATTANRVVQAIDARLSNARKWNGVLADGVTQEAARTALAIPAGVALGTTAGTACEGNDARLSNERGWTGAFAGDATAKIAARAAIGLGNAATKDVGTAAGTVAAGDHGHTFASITAKPYLPLDVKQGYAAVGDDTADDTAALQAAITAAGAGTVFLPNGTYKVSAKITLGANTRLIGQSRTGVIIHATHTDWAFEYLAPLDSGGDVTSSMLLENFSITAKNGIRLNQSGDFATVFSPQRAVLAVRIKDVNFNGPHVSGDDASSNSATLPVLATLQGYGQAIAWAKLVDATIEHCRFQGYGVAIFQEGCDLCSVKHNRFTLNARHLHRVKSGDGTWGSQVLFAHNDVLGNLRYGGLHLDSNFDLIKDNYFETYTAAACHIYWADGLGGVTRDNRFDNSGVATTPLVHYTSGRIRGWVFAGNQLNMSASLAGLTVDQPPVNYLFPNHGKVIGNSPFWPMENARKPGVLFRDVADDSLFDYTNFSVIGDVTDNPWTVSAHSGRYVIKSAPVFSTLLNIPDQLCDTIGVAIEGRLLTSGGYANIIYRTAGNTDINIYGGFLNTRGMETGQVSTSLITVKLPADRPRTGTPQLLIQWLADVLEVERVRVVQPQQFESWDADFAPNEGVWKAGERVLCRSGTAGMASGWICLTAGHAVRGDWTTSTAYFSGWYVANAGKIYRAESNGTSGATAPTHTSGAVSDGVVTWRYVATKAKAAFLKSGLFS
jgi:hypothetical protein